MTAESWNSGSANMFPWQPNHVTGATDTNATTEELAVLFEKIEELLEVLFSMRSVPRLCKER
jgi:hypothetical protein